MAGPHPAWRRRWGAVRTRTAYDLPDLKPCLAPRRLLIVNPVDQLFQPSRRLPDDEYRLLRRAYTAEQTGKISRFYFRKSFQLLHEVLSTWLETDR